MNRFTLCCFANDNSAWRSSVLPSGRGLHDSGSEIGEKYQSSSNAFVSSEDETTSNRWANSSGDVETRYEAAQASSRSSSFGRAASVFSETRIRLRCARVLCQKAK